MSLLKVGFLIKCCKKIWLPLIVVALSFSLSVQAMAEEAATDRRSPIKITSDQLEADKKSGLVKFKGNVVAVQEDATIMSEMLTVHYDSNNNMERIDAVGKVRINQQNRIGTCNKATFFPEEKKIVMNGDPRVWRDGDIISGSLITIYIDSDKMDVENAVVNMRPQNNKNNVPSTENGKEN